MLGGGSEPVLALARAAPGVTDLEVRATFAERFDFAVGANNLFDVYPTAVPRGRGIDTDTGLERNFPATNYVAPFSAFSPFGFNGRFVYGRASMRF